MFSSLATRTFRETAEFLAGHRHRVDRAGRLSANGETYDGSICFGERRTSSFSPLGTPSADAAKKALVNAGTILAKS